MAMIVKIIQSLINGKSSEVVGPGGIEEKQKQKETKFVDVAEEAMRKKAAEQSADLNGMVKYGWPHVKREKFKGSVRKRVWDMVTRSWGSSNDEMVEEITEKIADVAEVDPYYQEVFQDK